MLRPKLMVYFSRSPFADQESTSKPWDRGQLNIRGVIAALGGGGGADQGYVF
jgi:hypothetical protein